MKSNLFEAFLFIFLKLRRRNRQRVHIGQNNSAAIDPPIEYGENEPGIPLETFSMSINTYDTIGSKGSQRARTHTYETIGSNNSQRERSSTYATIRSSGSQKSDPEPYYTIK